MHKYVYYNKKIKEIIEDKNRVDIVLSTGGIFSYPKPEFYRLYSDAKIVDNFEDLIEVGDIIEFAVDFDYYVKSEVLDFQIIGEDDRKVINVFLDKVNYQSVKSIWKPVNNTFVRVAHKEAGSWVIDNE